MTRIASLVLAAIVLSSSSEDAAGRRGPPLVCHEIDIGSAASLPWKSVGYGMGPEPTFQLEKVIPETLKILRASDDAIVHMETLRRAYTYLHLHDPPAEQGLADLGAKLKDAILLASIPKSPTETTNTRRQTLAWFDLAYLVAIVNNNGGGECDFMREASCHGFLERVATGAQKDAGLQFGVGVGQAFNWIPRGIPDGEQDSWRAHGWKHLQTALDLTSDPDSPAGRNLRSFFGTGYGPGTKPVTLDEVRRKVAEFAAESRPR